MNGCFSRMAMVVLAVCGAMAQELTLRETPQGMCFGNDRFAVRLDARTGWAGDVLCDGQVVVKASDSQQFFDVRQDQKWVTGGGAAIEGLGVERAAPDTLRSRMKSGDWTVDAFVQLFTQERRLRRWFEVTWHGTGETKIRGFWFQAGSLPIAGDGGYFVPAQYPPRRIGAQELAEGHKTNSGRSPYPLIGETGGAWSAVWVSNELVPYADCGGTGAQESPGLIRVTQSFRALGHVRPGIAQTFGDAWLWLLPGDGEAALRRMPEWFRAVGQVPPADRPEWVKRLILYSFHPGGTIGSNCRDLGGFGAASALLPRLRDVGCNAVWLMPLEDQSIYCPRDYYKLQEGIGTPDDYKAFVAQARALGLRVWQDCVPHGGRNTFPRAQAHPEWLAQNEDGSTLDYWCFDFNWPTWIGYMRDVASFYTREYGIDGFRIDAVGGSHIPNWNPAVPYARASLSQSQGGLAMQRALRAAVKEVRADGANLAEVGGSVFGATSDAVYDFDLCYHVLHDFRREPPEVFVPRFRRWLHEQSYAEMPDLVRMRHIESHDSLRSELWYGADAQRALVAVASWIHGFPLVYHEMEDGHADAYRRIFQARREVPELTDGAADYVGVSAPAGVFACLRTNAAHASVALVNLSGQPARGAVSVPTALLPAGVRAAAWARDVSTGEKVAILNGALEIALAPFGYTVLSYAGDALPTLAPVPAAPRPKPVPVRAPTVAVKSGSGALLLDAQDGLPVAWKHGFWAKMPLGMDVALPAELAAGGAKAPVAIEERDGAVALRYAFGTRTLTVRYRPSGRDVEVRATWTGGAPEGAALVFGLPTATRWFADTAEGAFGDAFRVRHPSCEGVAGSIYRLPQGTATLWDSRRHPFGLDAAHACAGGEADGLRMAFVFDAATPASVQLLDRAGEDRGLKVLVAWRGSEGGAAYGGDELAFAVRTEKADSGAGLVGTGDPRLTEAGGGWQFENAHYRAWVSRSGTLAGLWRKSADGWQPVAKKSTLYTDHGFGEERFGQENDVEATARIERSGDAIRLSFYGEMRGFERFAKMDRPVRFYSAYTFGNGPAFRRTCAFAPEASATGESAFLSLITPVEGAGQVSFADASGVYLKGVRGDGKVRVAQTAKSADPRRLPREVRVSGASGLALRLSDIVWLGAPPENLFLHGGDLHLAWMDGRPSSDGAGRWRGASMSVACAEGAGEAAAETEVLMDACERTELLVNGDFEAAAGGGLTLWASGRVLPQPTRRDLASWRLPRGAEYVVEGGSRCVRVTGDGTEYRMVGQALPVKDFEAGTAWRLTARVKGEGVQRGDQGWKTACVRWAITAGGRSTFATASLPPGDSAWRELAVEVTVPAGVTSVAAEAGLNGNAGRLWVDDMRIQRR